MTILNGFIFGLGVGIGFAVSFILFIFVGSLLAVSKRKE